MTYCFWDSMEWARRQLRFMPEGLLIRAVGGLPSLSVVRCLKPRKRDCSVFLKNLSPLYRLVNCFVIHDGLGSSPHPPDVCDVVEEALDFWGYGLSRQCLHCYFFSNIIHFVSRLKRSIPCPQHATLSTSIHELKYADGHVAQVSAYKAVLWS